MPVPLFGSKPPVSMTMNSCSPRRPFAVVAVARQAGEVGHDRVAALGEPVEQRRLADVGAADEGDDGFSWPAVCGRLPRRRTGPPLRVTTSVVPGHHRRRRDGARRRSSGAAAGRPSRRDNAGPCPSPIDEYDRRPTPPARQVRLSSDSLVQATLAAGGCQRVMRSENRRRTPVLGRGLGAAGRCASRSGCRAGIDTADRRWNHARTQTRAGRSPGPPGRQALDLVGAARRGHGTPRRTAPLSGSSAAARALPDPSVSPERGQHAALRQRQRLARPLLVQTLRRRRASKAWTTRSTPITKTRSPATSGAVPAISDPRFAPADRRPSSTTSSPARHHRGEAAVAADAGDACAPSALVRHHRRRCRPGMPPPCHRAGGELALRAPSPRRREIDAADALRPDLAPMRSARRFQQTGLGRSAARAGGRGQHQRASQGLAGPPPAAPWRSAAAVPACASLAARRAAPSAVSLASISGGTPDRPMVHRDPGQVRPPSRPRSCPGRRGCRRGVGGQRLELLGASRRVELLERLVVLFWSASRPARRSRATLRYSVSAALSATQLSACRAASSSPLRSNCTCAPAGRPCWANGGAADALLQVVEDAGGLVRVARVGSLWSARRTSPPPSRPGRAATSSSRSRPQTGSTIVRPGDPGCRTVPERLELVELFLFFEIEMRAMAVPAKGGDYAPGEAFTPSVAAPASGIVMRSRRCRRRAAFDATSPRRSLHRRRISAKRAPLASARFNCDFKLPPPPAFINTANPARSKRLGGLSSPAPAAGDDDRRPARLRRRPAMPSSSSSSSTRSTPMPNRPPAPACRRVARSGRRSAAAAHRALRAELVGDPLEHGEVVVVHAAHQARVDAIGEAGGIEQARTASKCASETAQVVHQLGAPRRPASPGSCCRGCAAGCCAGGAWRPRRAPGMRLEVRDQRARCAARSARLAQAVELEAHVASFDDAQLASTARTIRISSASTSGPATQRLDAELVELAVAALLRPLVAEHRAHVVQAAARRRQQQCSTIGAHHAGGVLRRSVSGRRSSAVDEEYISFSTMSVTSPRPRTNSGVGSTMGVRWEVAVAAHQRADVLEPLPAGRIRRQDVVHALDGAIVQAMDLACGIHQRRSDAAAAAAGQRGTPQAAGARPKRRSM